MGQCRKVLFIRARHPSPTPCPPPGQHPQGGHPLAKSLRHVWGRRRRGTHPPTSVVLVWGGLREVQALGPFSRRRHKEGGGNRMALESYCRESQELQWERKKMYLSERMVGMFQYIDEE